MSDLLSAAIELTAGALRERSSATWILAFSGGKDSTALLKIFCAALLRTPSFSGTLRVVYCDTGVENPVLDQYVRGLFERATAEFAVKKLPLELTIVRAPAAKRFFVKIIGRGYPPPTNAFRWCTKDLRILPVSAFVESVSISGDVIVAIGSRLDESEQRKRSISRMGGGHWQKQREAKQRYDLFLPILDLNLETVWDAIFSLGTPDSIDASELERLYRGASGECPVVKETRDSPCAKGRFGCWTCTVVRRDRSAENLISEGYETLKPYLDVRNWLADFRNDKTARWPIRRSGRDAPGPFKIRSRLKILEVLKALEASTGLIHVTSEELLIMRQLMLEDIHLERSIFGRASASRKRILSSTSVAAA